MWRNAETAAFVGWLRARNARVPESERAGLFGLDLYGLRASAAAVLAYLDRVDPEGARRARARYACFDRFGDDPQAYGYAASLGLERGCEDAVVRQLVEMRERAADHAARDGVFHPDDHHHAAESARVVASAERYYRTMFRGRAESWNVRDEHMADALDALLSHLRRSGRSAKAVVWAHDSHVGDARASDLGACGEWSLGQLARERHGAGAYLVAQTTHHGTVVAATDWDGPGLPREVRPAIEGSYESLFHETGIPAFLLFPRGADGTPVAPEPLLERLIGVVYRPETERASHLVEARLSERYDAVMHLDETRALEPLEDATIRG
jgi:erythromycin esterase-like protein